MNAVQLSTYDNSWYNPGRTRAIQALWFFIGAPIVRSQINPSSSLRSIILRAFGSRIGRGVVIKPGVRVKYPWRLAIGDHSWIGEDCWLDNLAQITIGSNVCVSQGAYLCTGNHDWSDPSFGLKISEITLHDGAWVGAKCLIAPGIHLWECAIASAGSVVAKDISAYEVHAGNPAKFVRARGIDRTHDRTGSPG